MISSFYSWLLYYFCYLVHIRHCWRKCVVSAILRGWVTLRLNFRLKGYVLCWSLWTITQGNDCTTTLLLKVFCQRNIVADFIQLRLSFIQKRKSLLFEPPFGRLRGNVHTSSTACWKARVRLPIRHNWTFFASCYCWDITGGNLSTWAIFEGGWVTSIAHFRWKGTSPEGDVAHQPLLGGIKLEGLPFYVV